jgi:hypothetical protein
MLRSSSIISLQQKVPKLSNRGSLTISSPLVFAEGLFYLINYFLEKEGVRRNLLYIPTRRS